MGWQKVKKWMFHHSFPSTRCTMVLSDYQVVIRFMMMHSHCTGMCIESLIIVGCTVVVSCPCHQGRPKFRGIIAQQLPAPHRLTLFCVNTRGQSILLFLAVVVFVIVVVTVVVTK